VAVSRRGVAWLGERWRVAVGEVGEIQLVELARVEWVRTGLSQGVGVDVA